MHTFLLSTFTSRPIVLFGLRCESRLAAADEGHSDVIELTSDTFEAETQNAALILVEFFAPWYL